MEKPSPNHAPESSVQINARENYELQFWTKRFHINRETLKEAVNKVGNSAEEVERYLRRQRLCK